MTYIEHLNASFEAFAIDKRLDAGHRILYLSLVHHWNRKGRRCFRLLHDEIMLLSDLGRTTYRQKLADLENFGYVNWQRGNSFKDGSLICISAISPNGQIIALSESDNLTLSESDTATMPKSDTITNSDRVRQNATVSNSDMLSAKSVSNADIVLNTVYRVEKSLVKCDNINNNLNLKEKNAGTGEQAGAVIKFARVGAKAQYSGKAKPPGTTFLQSDIGNLPDFTNYIVNESAYPHANPSFYFQAVADWRDKTTGLEPIRPNWKLVVNQFFRNDIARNGKVTSEQHARPTNNHNDRIFNNGNNKQAHRIESPEAIAAVNDYLASHYGH